MSRWLLRAYIEIVLSCCPNRVTHVKLVEPDIVDFDVISGMDWLHDRFASIDCRTRIVKFNFTNEPVLELKGGGLYS